MIVYAYFMTIAGLLGLIVGSFLNVVIYRLPERLSVVSPRSRCPACETPIAWYDNVPVLSWTFLRGRCRHCGVGISARYTLVELLTCGVALVVFWQVVPAVDLHHVAPALGGTGEIVAVAAPVRWQDLLTWLYLFVFFSGLIAVFFIDLDHYIVPNQITYPLIPLGVAGSAGLWYVGANVVSPLQSALGVLAGGGVLYAVAMGGSWLFNRQAMGMGDVKLLALIGAFLGAWPTLLVVLLLSSVAGSVIGIALRVLGRARTSEPLDPDEQRALEADEAPDGDPEDEEPGGPTFHYIPYGPFLVLGAFAWFLIGDWILGLYQLTLY
jgi:leader peptidase (prepilin peptidase) / N-methyltransferase